MQPNMSEGKSSVIIPTVAAALADGSRLVYVIVDNPQPEQMFQILVSKLGSFLDRQVYHMPFSLCPEAWRSWGKCNWKYLQGMHDKGRHSPRSTRAYSLIQADGSRVPFLISGKEVVSSSLLSTKEFPDSIKVSEHWPGSCPRTRALSNSLISLQSPSTRLRVSKEYSRYLNYLSNYL